MQRDPRDYILHFYKPSYVDYENKGYKANGIWVEYDLGNQELRSILEYEYYNDQIKQYPLLMVGWGSYLFGFVVFKTVVQKMVIKVKLDKIVYKIIHYQNDYILVVFSDHTFSILNIKSIYDSGVGVGDDDLELDQSIEQSYEHSCVNLNFNAQQVDNKDRISYKLIH